jgi:hypothetical protein
MSMMPWMTEAEVRQMLASDGVGPYSVNTLGGETFCGHLIAFDDHNTYTFVDDDGVEHIHLVREIRHASRVTPTMTLPQVVDVKGFEYECPACAEEGKHEQLRYAGVAASVSGDPNSVSVTFKCPKGHERVVMCPKVTQAAVESIKVKYAESGLKRVPVWFTGE